MNIKPHGPLFLCAMVLVTSCSTNSGREDVLLETSDSGVIAMDSEPGSITDQALPCTDCAASTLLKGTEARPVIIGPEGQHQDKIAWSINQTQKVKLVKIRLRTPDRLPGGSQLCIQQVCIDLEATAKLFRDNQWSMMVMFQLGKMKEPTEYEGDYDAYVAERAQTFTQFVIWFVRQFGASSNLRYVELLNYPGNSWRGTPEQLVEMCNGIYDQLKALDPNLMVGTPGFEYFKASEQVQPDIAQVDAFLAPENSARFDFYAFHGYRTRTKQVEYPPTHALLEVNPYTGIPGMIAIRKKMNDNGWHDRLIIDTEHTYLFPWDDFSEVNTRTSAAIAVQKLVVAQAASLQGRPVLDGVLPLKTRPRGEEGESSWGSLMSDGEETDVVRAVGGLWENLAHYRHDARVSGQYGQAGEVWVERFVQPEQARELYVLFKPFELGSGHLLLDGQELEFTLQLKGLPLRVEGADIFGESVQHEVSSSLPLRISNIPQYLWVQYPR